MVYDTHHSTITVCACNERHVGAAEQGSEMKALAINQPYKCYIKQGTLKLQQGNVHTIALNIDINIYNSTMIRT